MTDHKKVRLDHLLGVYSVGSGDWPWSEEYDNLIDQPRTQGVLAGIRDEGIREPILLGTDGRVWDGHHRIVVAMHIGIDSVPVEFAGVVAEEPDPSAEDDEFTPGECTGAGDCGAPIHVHGCYRPHRADQCDAPDEYGHIEPQGEPLRDADGDMVSSGEHRKIDMEGDGFHVCDTCVNALGLNIRWDQSHPEPSETTASVDAAGFRRPVSPEPQTEPTSEPSDDRCGGCRDLGPHRNVRGCEFYKEPQAEPTPINAEGFVLDRRAVRAGLRASSIQGENREEQE